MIIIVGILVAIFGLPVLVALGPLWVIVLLGGAVLWGYSAIDDARAKSKGKD